MKCYSRSTLGVIIGGLNIFFYIGVSIVVIQFMKKDAFHLKSETLSFQQREETVALSTVLLSTIFSVCLLMVLISGLLIMGIVKRRHKLMWPWLALSGLGFVCNVIRVIFSLIVGFYNDIPIQTLLIMLVAGALAVGVHALILWPIYTLCRDIGEKNNQQPGRVVTDAHYSFVSPPPYNYQISPLHQKS